MTIKVFISYSHKDEKYKESLEEHLTMLKRNEVIETWNDREITAGSDWENEIDDNLSNAEIILYLISPSFLASDYCYCNEFESVLSKHKEGKCRIIPIIVRTCDWQNSPLGKIQGLPKDGVAVNAWKDVDSGWMNVINGIKLVVEELKKKLELAKVNNFSESFRKFLDDTNIPFYKKGRHLVSLNDIYVPPDLIRLNSEDRMRKFDICNIYQDGKYIVYGDEKSGKSSLLKWIFKEFSKLNKNPIYVDLSTVHSLKDKYDFLNNIYKNIYSEDINYSVPIILDNFDKANFINNKSRKEFIEYINLDFKNIIISFDTDNSFLKEELDCFNEYIELRIKNFGFEKREELIKKWYSIGVEETISDEELYNKIDEAKDKISSILLKNVLPAKPMYILLILSLMESGGNVEFTSYGHCYQQLIYQSFDNAKIKKLDFDKYMNVLKEMSWEFFLHNKNLTDKDISSFFYKYGNEYLSVDQRTTIEKMIKAHIISFDGFEYSFKYPYIYYFFIGKKISESYFSDSKVKNKVDEIFSGIYKDDYAAILVFINHHSRDTWLTERIMNILNSLFSDIDEASLDKSGLSFMRSFYEDIPKMIIESKTDVREARRKKNVELDRIEEDRQGENLYNTEDEYDAPYLIKDIQSLFKCIEIIGQIIKSRHSSIKRTELLNIIRSGISAGLRFLNYFIQVSDVTKNRAVDYIHSLLSKDGVISDSELRNKVEYFYLFLIYKIIFNIIIKISSSIGSKEAIEIYLSLSEEKNTIAIELINEDIFLSFSKNLDVSRVEKLKNKFKGNEIANLILSDIVVNHLETFPVEYKKKQRIANILGIGMKGINLISNSKCLR